MTNNQSNELRDAINEYGTQVAFITKRFVSGEYDEAERDRLWLEAATALEAYCKDRERQARINEHELMQHQATVNLKSAKAVVGWSELRVEQLKGDKS